MQIVNIAVRRRHLALLLLSPAPNLKELQSDRRALIPETEGEQLLIDRTVIERCGLAVGDLLSPAEVNELVKVSLCYRAKEKAVWYLSKAPRTKRGLYDKLRQTFGSVPAQFAVEQMEQRGYLNDQNYAARLAELLAQQNLSARAARQKMLQKGLDRETTDAALAAQFSGDETEKAVALIYKKYIHKLEDEADLRKTTAALLRRGFSYSTIRQAYQTIKCGEFPAEGEPF